MDQSVYNFMRNKYELRPFGYHLLSLDSKEVDDEKNPVGLTISPLSIYEFRAVPIVLGYSKNSSDLFAPGGIPAQVLLEKVENAYYDNEVIVSKDSDGNESVDAVVRLLDLSGAPLDESGLMEEARNGIFTLNKWLLSIGYEMKREIVDEVLEMALKLCKEAAQAEAEKGEILIRGTDEFIRANYENATLDEVKKMYEECDADWESARKAAVKQEAEEWKENYENRKQGARRNLFNILNEATHRQGIDISTDELEKRANLVSDKIYQNANVDKIIEVVERMENGERVPLADMFDALGISKEEFEEGLGAFVIEDTD